MTDAITLDSQGMEIAKQQCERCKWWRWWEGCIVSVSRPLPTADCGAFEETQ